MSPAEELDEIRRQRVVAIWVVAISGSLLGLLVVWLILARSTLDYLGKANTPLTTWPFTVLMLISGATFAAFAKQLNSLKREAKQIRANLEDDE